MMKFINELLMSFRPCFSRKATFDWFVVIVAGLLIRTDHLGVTSVIRALFLSSDYMGLIGFFRSSAWTLEALMSKWCGIVAQNASIVKAGGACVIVGDAVKNSKEGRRMPGVKRHRQESDNSSKADYIFGHLFGGVGVLAEKDGKSFCIPLSMTLQDGVKTIFGWDEAGERQDSHVVETIRQAGKIAKQLVKAILLLDRQYLSVPGLLALDEANADGHVMHIVTKAKSNCTAYEEPGPTPRGRPRLKGAAVKIFSLFKTAAEQFKSAKLSLYEETREVRYHCVDLLWGKKLYRKLRFVLVEYDGKYTVLVSTDLELDPLEIIQLYGRRFGIEVMFREMKQVVCAFGYRFWSKYMPKLNRFKKKTDIDPIEQVDDPKARKRIMLAIKAIEGFMFCAVVATGVLQMVSLTFSGTDEMSKLRFLRTKRKSIASEATVADFLQKNFLRLLLSAPNLPICQIISAKQGNILDCSGFDRAA